MDSRDEIATLVELSTQATTIPLMKISTYGFMILIILISAHLSITVSGLYFFVAPLTIGIVLYHYSRLALTLKISQKVIRVSTSFTEYEFQVALIENLRLKKRGDKFTIELNEVGNPRTYRFDMYMLFIRNEAPINIMDVLESVCGQLRLHEKQHAP
jgi:hypothetical protein